MLNEQRLPAAGADVGDIHRVKEGLPVSELETLAKLFGVPEDQMASSLNICGSTLTDRKKEGRFRSCESERIWRFKSLYDRGEEVLGSREKTMQWFHTPKRCLCHKTPFEIADTEPGAQSVRRLFELMKIVRFSG